MRGTWQVDYSGTPIHRFVATVAEPHGDRATVGRVAVSTRQLETAPDPGALVARQVELVLNRLEGERSRWAQFSTGELAALACTVDPSIASGADTRLARELFDEVTAELGRRA